MDLWFLLSSLGPPLITALAVYRATSRRERQALRRDSWFILAIVAALLADRWVLGFASKDLFLIQRELAAELSLGSGGNAFLSTLTGLGKPILAHPLHAVLYPFAWVLLVPNPDLGVQLYLGIHVLWGAAWWWLLFAQEPETSRGQRHRWWIRAGVTLAMLNGFMVSRIAGSQGIEYLLGAVWLPQAAYALTLVLRGRRLFPAVCLLALALSSMAAVCPNLTLASLPVLGVFSMIGLWGRRSPSAASRVVVLASLLSGISLALLMMIPELVPAVEVLSQNAGFTYALDPGNYRFRPYTGPELITSVLALREPNYGRDPVFWIGGLAAIGILMVVSGRFLWGRVLAAAVLIGLAVDWATGARFLAMTKILSAFPGQLSISPAAQGLIAWSGVALFAASIPSRRVVPSVGLGLVLLLAATMLYPTRFHRIKPGYDIAREARLFVWSDGLSVEGDRPLVADIQPPSEHAHLIPDPVARAQGIRTIGEDWYSLLPRPFYETLLPQRRNDWEQLHRMGVHRIVSIYPENSAPRLWRLQTVYDADSLSQEAESRGSFLAFAVRWLHKIDTSWDGKVRVYIPTVAPASVPDPPDRDNGYRLSKQTRWTSRGWILISLVLGPLLAFKRLRKGDRPET